MGLIALQRSFTAGKLTLLLVDQTVSEDQTPGTYPMMTRIPSVDIGVIPWEKYIAYYTNIYMVGRIDIAGGFKPYLWNLYQFRHPLDLIDGR